MKPQHEQGETKPRESRLRRALYAVMSLGVVAALFGGTFAMKQPETSVAMADDKIDGLLATGATELVGCDQSCLLHLAGRLDRRGETAIRVRHLAEVLDEAAP